MALLEYANLTIPQLVKKYVPSFENRDPLFKRMRQANKIVRSGGTQVRIRRVKGRHSDAVEINGTNIVVPLNKIETFSIMTGDWSKLIKPIILPHVDRDRLSDKAEIKRWVDQCTRAALGAHFIELLRRLYTGTASNAAYNAIGSFNGSNTSGTASGLVNGALRFQTPTAQASAAITYLNETRVEDTTYYTNNWFNQFKAHTGIGTDFLKTVEEIKITADSYAMEDDNQGISLGALSIADHVKLGEEVRTYPGGGGVSAITYTLDDIEKGRAHPTVHIAGGIHYYSNRWMTASSPATESCFLFNPTGIEYWVNANNDHRVTKITDHLETSNQDADVGYIVCEIQVAVPELLLQGATSQ